MNIVDRSFGRHHLDWRLTMTAHLLVPVDRRPGRPSVLQAVLIHTPLAKDSVARVSVLADDFTWAVLLDLPAAEWSVGVDAPMEETMSEALEDVANDLLRRAATILGAVS
ncbi:hypothetical protein GCM10023063_15440 [Arthrobacter methylotrophus]|uniref:Uncharacterized protein n=1 Tax=Arthrobacter methylotrophus TaxID=121291 RepID=A0ABV5UN54_9MICC